MAHKARTMVHRRAPRSAVGMAAALAVVGGLVAVTSPAQASEPVTPTATTAQAGYLDRTFAGGAGYRTIPKPINAKGGAWGVDLAVSPGGLIRTLSRHDIVTPGASGYDRALLRSWTSTGWIDRTFWSGQAKNMGVFDSESGIGGLTPTANESVSLTQGSALSPIIGSRINRDGRVGVSKDLGSNDTEYQGDFAFKPDGSLISCSSSNSGMPPTALGFRNASLSLTGRTTLDSLACSELALSGSHLWEVDADSTKIARTSLTGVLDTRWGGDGYITSNVSGWYMDGQGMSDGSLYVKGEKKLGTNRQRGVARFTPSGDPDPAFGRAGFASIGGNGTILRGRTADVYAWSVGPKGPVLAVAVSDPGVKNSTRYRLIRLTKAGKLDATFGSGGIIQTTTPTTALAHDAQGRILTVNSSATGAVTLARRSG